MEFNENKAIEVSNVRDIPTITEEIKGLCNQFANITLAFGVEIGRRLYEAKQLLDHGQWGKWLEENFEFSQRTANNMMKLFDEYGAAQITLFGAVTNSQTFSNLTAVKALKLLALEPSERENFAQENDVENMSVRALEKAIKDKKEAEKQVEELYKENDKLVKDIHSLEDENADLKTALDDVKDNTSALENVQAELKAAEQEKAELSSQLAKAKEAEKKAKEKLKEIKANPQISDEDLARITAEAEAKAAEAHKEAIEQAKAKADERIAEAVKARFDVEEALTEARKQKEELEKKIKMLSPEMVNFKSAFENLQDGIGKLLAAFRELSPEYAEKFRPAVQQLKEKISV